MEIFPLLLLSLDLTNVDMMNSWRCFLARSQNCGKLRNVCLSAYPHGTTRPHWTDFRKIWCLNILRKSVEKIQISLKSDKN